MDRIETTTATLRAASSATALFGLLVLAGCASPGSARDTAAPAVRQPLRVAGATPGRSVPSPWLEAEGVDDAEANRDDVPPGVGDAVRRDARSLSRPEQLPPLTGGAYFSDDGPGSLSPTALSALASLDDPEPSDERLVQRANRPYRVMGRDYVPMTRREAIRQVGRASWYGRKFHGKATSIGERYDMYSMSAAHPTFPLPSYARVTNRENGRSVIVRVNDRGPFLQQRVIDLSLMAAYKLGYAAKGHAEVEVDLLPTSATPGENVRSPEILATASTAKTESAVPGGMQSAAPTIGSAAARDVAPKAVRTTVTAPPDFAAALPAGPTAPSSVDQPAAAPSPVAASMTAAGVNAASTSAASTSAASVGPASVSPASTSTASTSTASPTIESASGAAPVANSYFVQVAAFNGPERASVAKQKLLRQLEWLSTPLETQVSEGVYRLRVGPIGDRGEAQRLASRIRSSMLADGANARPFVVPVR